MIHSRITLSRKYAGNQKQVDEGVRNAIGKLETCNSASKEAKAITAFAVSSADSIEHALIRHDSFAKKSRWFRISLVVISLIFAFDIISTDGLDFSNPMLVSSSVSGLLLTLFHLLGLTMEIHLRRASVANTIFVWALTPNEVMIASALPSESVIRVPLSEITSLSTDAVYENLIIQLGSNRRAFNITAGYNVAATNFINKLRGLLSREVKLSLAGERP